MIIHAELGVAYVNSRAHIIGGERREVLAYVLSLA